MSYDSPAKETSEDIFDSPLTEKKQDLEQIDLKNEYPKSDLSNQISKITIGIDVTDDPVKESPIESLPKNIPIVKYGQIKVFGEETFLDFEQPDDEINECSKEDKAETSVPQKCTGIPKLDLFEDASFHKSTIGKSILNLVWMEGLNETVPIINLTKDVDSLLFYTVANTGVIFNLFDHTQIFMQGHANNISAISASGDGRWLVTGDKGPNSMIIVWDSKYKNMMVPVRTIFSCQPDVGVSGLALSKDAKYLATISAGNPQVISIWDWTIPDEEPICYEVLKQDDNQFHVLFKPDDPSQLVSNSESNVIFYSWSDGKIRYTAPQIKDSDFNRPIGKFVRSVFVPNTQYIITATENGNIVVWQKAKNMSLAKEDELTPNKNALKMINSQDNSITYITTFNEFIVTGGADGVIRFYDYQLKIVKWYNELNLGPIQSFSFDDKPKATSDFEEERENCVGPGNIILDASIKSKKMFIQNFIVASRTGNIARVQIKDENVKIVNQHFDLYIPTIVAHPSKPILAIGCTNGIIRLWQYHLKKTLISRQFSVMIQSMAFNKTGAILAVGFASGSLTILNTFDLSDYLEMPYTISNFPIVHITFSENSNFIATADTSFAVTIFRYINECSQSMLHKYAFNGRYRAHNKNINALFFITGPNDKNKAHLFSLSEDRLLVEYSTLHLIDPADVKASIIVDSVTDVEQYSTPLCMCRYPSEHENLFLISNDKYKFKMIEIQNKTCRKTIQMPTYGSPIKIMLMPFDKAASFFAFANDDKVGIMKMPLDGNPYKSCAIIDHPNGISSIALSHDNKYLFTAGENSFLTYTINFNALDAQVLLGGEDLVPFLNQLDGGVNGALYRELENLFYYAQIKNQGICTMETRPVADKLSIEEIPFLMRALGFYPSQRDIQEMINEVKYSNYFTTNKFTLELDLSDFIKLYINHRPPFGLKLDDIYKAFETLATKHQDGIYRLQSTYLFRLLKTTGEKMKEEEFSECFNTLLDILPPDNCCLRRKSEMDYMGHATIADVLPEYITSTNLVRDILGFKIE